MSVERFEVFERTRRRQLRLTISRLKERSKRLEYSQPSALRFPRVRAQCPRLGGRATMIAAQRPDVYIIAPNRLAGEYLGRILSEDNTIHPVLCDRLPVGSSTANPSVFVLDASSQLLPVTECLNKLISR